MMKTKLVATCFVIGALLIPTFSYAEDVDLDRSHPKAYVKDSVITTKVKAKLAKEKIASVAHIKVDIDNSGVVWLSGTAKTQAEIDQAGSIARSTQGVASVKNDIKLDEDR